MILFQNKKKFRVGIVFVLFLPSYTNKHRAREMRKIVTENVGLLLNGVLRVMKIKSIISGEYDKVVVNILDGTCKRMNKEYAITDDSTSFTVYPGALTAALCDESVNDHADDVELYLASKASAMTAQQLSLILFKAEIEIEQTVDTAEHDFVRTTFKSIKMSKKSLELLDEAINNISL